MRLIQRPSRLDCRWRELAKIGNQTTDKHILPEQATIDKIYDGPGNLKPVDLAAPTL